MRIGTFPIDFWNLVHTLYMYIYMYIHVVYTCIYWKSYWPENELNDWLTSIIKAQEYTHILKQNQHTSVQI